MSGVVDDQIRRLRSRILNCSRSAFEKSSDGLQLIAWRTAVVKEPLDVFVRQIKIGGDASRAWYGSVHCRLDSDS
jgi:hypothetical protein